MRRLRIALLDTLDGGMLAAFSERGLTALEHGSDLAAFGEALSRRFRQAVGEQDDATELTRQLDEFLAGERRGFDLPIDLDDLAAFNRRTLLAVCEIPYGETRTYGELAAQLDHPGAARAVGNALSRSPISIVVPCHRVVRASDGLGGWGGNIAMKRRLLALERRVAYGAAPGAANAVVRD